VRPKWKFEPNEHDLTIMRIEVEGLEETEPVRIVWSLHDEAGGEPFTRSMSRVTAWPAAECARLLASRDFSAPGVHPPERLAREEGVVERFLGGLEARGVTYSRDACAR
jgi:saccharopine dehydrogenase-like NADP-dependent oxidoreductase